ncbi:unnamed protein product [Malus baccata var. baccata]
MSVGEEQLDCLNITLEERFDTTIHLVGRLIVDHELSQTVVKEVIHSAWNKMAVVRVLRVKANLYVITVGEEVVARRLLEGNPWFIRDYTFSAHGIPRNYCTLKNAKCLVNFDTSKPLLTSFSVSCPKLCSYTIRLHYEGLRIFYYKCGRLGHSSGCPRPTPILPSGESRFNQSFRIESLFRASFLLFPISRLFSKAGANEHH